MDWDGFETPSSGHYEQRLHRSCQCHEHHVGNSLGYLPPDMACLDVQLVRQCPGPSVDAWSTVNLFSSLETVVWVCARTV